MKYIYSESELEQKSKAWHDLRLSGIGASELAAILSLMPPHWSNPYEVYLKKLGKPQSPPNEAMLRGVHLEERAKNAVSNHLTNCIQEDNSIFCRNSLNFTDFKDLKNVKFKQYTAIYKDFPHMFASFDGVDKTNQIVLEIKCPSESNFRKIIKKPSVGRIYKPQVQAQLMIAHSHWGINKGIFANYYPEGVYITNKTTDELELVRLVLVQTELDVEYCKELVKICKAFWKNVENKTWNKNWKEYE